MVRQKMNNEEKIRALSQLEQYISAICVNLCSTVVVNINFLIYVMDAFFLYYVGPPVSLCIISS